MLIRTEIWTVGKTEKGIAALLRHPNSPRCIPIYLNSSEAQIILAALAGLEERPPRFPEMFCTLSQSLRAFPQSVEIFIDESDDEDSSENGGSSSGGLTEGVSAGSSLPEGQSLSLDPSDRGTSGKYSSVIHFSGENRYFSLEAWVPDALAFAVRMRIPMMVDDLILKEDGIFVSMMESKNPFDAQLGRLREELERRVEEEDYEQAAQIWDRINQIEERMRAGTDG